VDIQKMMQDYRKFVFVFDIHKDKITQYNAGLSQIKFFTANK